MRQQLPSLSPGKWLANLILIEKFGAINDTRVTLAKLVGHQ
jgi:hypothetical protein